MRSRTPLTRKGLAVPLGLPPHLASSTTTLALVRAGHAAAAASLVAAMAVVLTLQTTLPDLAVWPALIVLVPMIGLLVLLERTPSTFIAVGYLLVGGACIAWFTVIGSAQLEVTPRNDDFTVGLLKAAVILIVGVGPGIARCVLWTTAGLLVAETSSAVVIVALGGVWVPAPGPITLWVFLVLGLASLQLRRLQARTAIPALYRAARDEMLAETRRGFERRATALVHDTMLNDLALIAQHDVGPLRPGIGDAVRADLATLVGEEWLVDEASPSERSAHAEFERMLADATAGELTVVVAGDPGILDRVDGHARAEFLRAIGQALVNVRRHAGVTEAEVVLGAQHDEVSAMVVDAGRGFDPTPGVEGRLGVGLSIVARLEAIGGEAQLWSRVGSGTTVMLRLPLAAPPVSPDPFDIDDGPDARPQSAPEVTA